MLFELFIYVNILHFFQSIFFLSHILTIVIFFEVPFLFNTADILAYYMQLNRQLIQSLLYATNVISRHCSPIESLNHNFGFQLSPPRKMIRLLTHWRH